MHTKLIEEEIKYTGEELAPHWIYRNFHLQGDAIVAFKGECEVKLTEMVDIEDVINNEPIYSKLMLNFIIEHFNIGLVEGVVRQRLLICIIKEVLEAELCEKMQRCKDAKMQSELNDTFHISPFTFHSVTRNGDDIFVDGKKLSVSIATKSLTSVLMHIGLNIDPTGAPVEAIGLGRDLNIVNIDDFAQKVMVRYSQEIDDIILASTKVIGR